MPTSSRTVGASALRPVHTPTSFRPVTAAVTSMLPDVPGFQVVGVAGAAVVADCAWPSAPEVLSPQPATARATVRMATETTWKPLTPRPPITPHPPSSRRPFAAVIHTARADRHPHLQPRRQP